MYKEYQSLNSKLKLALLNTSEKTPFLKIKEIRQGCFLAVEIPSLTELTVAKGVSVRIKALECFE